MFAPENYGLDEIVTVETEICIPARWRYRVNREAGTVELIEVKITGPMSHAIVSKLVRENLPDRDEEEAETMVRALIAKEARGDANALAITQAENDADGELYI